MNFKQLISKEGISFGLNAPYFIQSALIALAYLMPGLITVELVNADGFIINSAFSTGIALAIVLHFGLRTIPGLFLGALLLFLYATFKSFAIISVSLSAILAFSIMLQMWLCVKLVKKYFHETNYFNNGKNIFLFLILCGPIACICIPSISCFFLLQYELLNTDTWFTNWLNMWITDSIGVVLITPMTLLLLTNHDKNELKSTNLPCGIYFIIFALLFVLYLFNLHIERTQSLLRFEALVNEQADNLNKGLIGTERLVHSITGFYAGSKFVDRDEFKIYVNKSFEKFEFIQAVEWVPRVSFHEKEKYINMAIADGLDNFQITEKDSNGKLIPVKDRDWYYPVYYLEPYTGNVNALGFDLGSEKKRLKTLQRAADSGQPTVSEPITLVQGEKKSRGLLFFHPVYLNGKPIDTLEQRRENLAGFALGVHLVDKLIQATTNGVSSNKFDLNIHDTTFGIRKPIYANGDVNLNNILFRKELPIGGRTWMLEASPKYNLLEEKSFTGWILIFITLSLALASSVLILTSLYRARTIRKLVDEKTLSLERTSKYLSGILESAVDAIISIDTKGNILSLNPAAEDIFGYQADKLLGENVKVLMPTPYHEEHDGYLKNYLGTGRKKVIGIGREVTGKRKDGSTFPMELSVSEVVVGDIHTFTGIVRDISARKAAEHAIIQAKEQAEVANKTKSDFLATMSHEIRTPMNGVLGMSHILLETKLTTEQRDYVNSIKSSGDALLTIINDILDLSKIEAGKLEIEPITFDLKATMFEMAELLTVAAKNKGLELILHFPSNVHPMLIGDPGRIRQILLNLASNAIKFTDKGHVLISIKNISANDTQLTSRFSIEDTGIGIKKSAQRKLFNAFTQEDASTTRKYGGTGLGLTICQRLVELMGGSSIHINSKPGKGSKFWFDLTLPIAERKIQALPSLPENINNIRVLVVDDNEVNRHIYSEYLKSWGIKSETADSATKAIKLLKRGTMVNKPFHIVLSDYCMPEINGEEFASKTFADTEIVKPRFILLASTGTRGDNKRFFNAGFSGYLIKPIDPSVLMNVLIQLIDQVNNKQETSELITRHSIEQSRLKEKIDVRTNDFSKTIRVLLAEDNLVNQKVAIKILQKMNCTVDAAANGQEAVNMVKQFPYQLIFMDCQMPEMDGYEATGVIKKYLKEHNMEIPIIAMTANAIKGDREKCIAAGMDDYLSKPIDQNKLQSVIKKWTSERPAQDIAI